MQHVIAGEREPPHGVVRRLEGRRGCPAACLIDALQAGQVNLKTIVGINGVSGERKATYQTFPRGFTPWQRDRADDLGDDHAGRSGSCRGWRGRRRPCVAALVARRCTRERVFPIVPSRNPAGERARRSFNTQPRRRGTDAAPGPGVNDRVREVRVLDATSQGYLAGMGGGIRLSSGRSLMMVFCAGPRVRPAALAARACAPGAPSTFV